jgi:hypothetical protein
MRCNVRKTAPDRVRIACPVEYQAVGCLLLVRTAQSVKLPERTSTKVTISAYVSFCVKFFKGSIMLKRSFDPRHTPKRTNWFIRSVTLGRMASDVLRDECHLRPSDIDPMSSDTGTR